MVKEPEVNTSDDKFDELADELRKLSEAEVVDEAKLEKLSSMLEEMSPATQKKVTDLPVIQKLLEKAAESVGDRGVPGSIIRMGILDLKIPWKMEHLEKYNKVHYVPTENETIIWNGLTFFLQRDEEYDLPEPVFGVIQDRRTTIREMRRKEATEIGAGVKFLQVGTAGKDNEDKE